MPRLSATIKLGNGPVTGPATPVPASDTVVVPLLVTTVRIPVRGPAAVGRKTTVMVRHAPLARPTPPVSVITKSPVTLTLDTPSAEVPVLQTVTCWGGLLLPTAWSRKTRL